MRMSLGVGVSRWMRRWRGTVLVLCTMLGAGGGCWLAARAQTVERTGAPLPGGAELPATVLVIRHAEKLPDGAMDLAPAGFERARRLPKLFEGPGARFPKPQVIFATHESAHSRRPVETVTPLAKALGLTIDDSIANDDYAALAAKVLGGAYAGEVVLISWHHGKIPQLTEALGATPPYMPWPEGQFDRVWRIDYAGGRAKLTDLPQSLFPADSK